MSNVACTCIGVGTVMYHSSMHYMVLSSPSLLNIILIKIYFKKQETGRDCEEKQSLNTIFIVEHR